MKAKTPLMAILILSFLLISFRPASAKENQIGIVDFQKVFEESTVIRKMNDNLQDKIKAQEQEIEKKREDLAKMQQDLEKKKALMNADARTQKEEELRQKLKDLKRYADDKKDEFQRKGNSLMQAIMKDLTKIVQEIRKEKGYTAILERSSGGVVCCSPSVDITEEVISEYDKRNK
ncbi:MAG: OmpH family outer membrane protein [Deltaproteobacteria bacterium]|nr:OmpH family outer membrane protein [Deltaproteobacteria bacterium]